MNTAMNKNARKRRAHWILAICVLIGFIVSAGCTHDTEKAAPSDGQSDRTDKHPIRPGLICQSQHPEPGTDVFVIGQLSSPVTVDLPEHATPALPTVSLIRAQKLDGASVDKRIIPYSANPSEPNAKLLSWESQQQFSFNVRNEVKLGADEKGKLPTGLYNIRVKTPEGTATTSENAFGVTERPRLRDTDPGIVCVEDRAQSVSVQGTTILKTGEESAVAKISGQTYPVESYSDCSEIPHPGFEARYCEQASIRIDQGSLEPGYGFVELDNPGTASCRSVPEQDGVKLRRAPAPTVSSIEPVPSCTVRGMRQVRITGNNFLGIDGKLPSVKVGENSVRVQSIAGDCSSLETQEHDVRACSQMTAFVSNKTGSEIKTSRVTVTNPAPANCSGSTEPMLTMRSGAGSKASSERPNARHSKSEASRGRFWTRVSKSWPALELSTLTLRTFL